MASVAQLAYELSLRALDQQEASLRELRARTGTLLGAASVTASFLGAPALERGLTVPVAFTAVMALSLVILMPKADVRFGVYGSEVDEVLDGCERDEAQRRLARWMVTLHASNQCTVDTLLRRFEWASGALAAETLLPALGLALR